MGLYTQAVDATVRFAGESVKAARVSIQALVDFLRRREQPQSAESVLSEEHDAIAESRLAKALGAPPAFTLKRPDYIGLSFSGGGIRSATFNLGVLQALARCGLLSHIDYLSTVSGGGYIGSWLVAWIKRRAEPDPNQTFSELSRHASAALARVQELLRPDQADPDSSELEPIRNLRRYSNYLTPAPSLLSADVWTMAAIWFRNTLLNLAIIVCLIAAVLLPARFVALGLRTWTESEGMMLWRWPPEAWFSVLALLISSFFISLNLLRVSSRARQEESRARGETNVVDRTATDDQGFVQILVLWPATIGAAAVAGWIFKTPDYFIDNWSSWVTLVLTIGFALITCLGEFPLGFAARLTRASKPHVGWRIVGYVAGVILSVLTAFVTAAMLYGVATAVAAMRTAETIKANEAGALNMVYDPWLPWIVASFGPPAVLVISALGLALQVGLVGRDVPDASREWLGRLRAWSIIYGAVWAGVFGVSLFGPWLLYSTGAWAHALGAGWILTTIAGLLAGNSEHTIGDSAKGVKSWTKEIVATVAPYVFMGGVFVLVSWGIHEIVSAPRDTMLVHEAGPSATIAAKPDQVRLTVGESTGAPYSHFEARLARYTHDLAFAKRGFSVGFPDVTSITLGIGRLRDVDLYNLTMLLLTAIVAGAILAWRVDINEFSMHHFYKNRLVRCYLGASRRNRTPDPFTGFDGGDDFPLAMLRPVGQVYPWEKADLARTIYCGPYPIINAALNISGGNSLAWQERQAASYVFTPLYTGFDKPFVDREATVNIDDNSHAFRPTDQCGYIDGITLGQAMAISGAAASPNSGYHTSTAVAFFLTVLNARLGWWLGNPAMPSQYKNSSPPFGLSYLLVELFGLANTQRNYVNLSDGGHFDNLGIYELVRRRCKYVIVCDGEQDPEVTFGGLAGVIRKCRTDFGAQIDIDVDQLRLNAERMSATHCVVGTITYDNGHQGRLLYLKASLTGNEEPDVLEYRSRNNLFPHQSTGDQWFDESQFESYRRLGLHAAESAFRGIDPLSRRTQATYDEQKTAFFDDVQLRHHPRSKLIGEYFTRHTEKLTDLLKAFVNKTDFLPLDDSVLSEWTPLGTDKPDIERAARFWCNSMIQLMENVYLDLNLDDLNEQEHPDNAGWMLLFRGWSVTPVFRRTWAIVGSVYGKRFQQFFSRLQAKAGDRVIGRWNRDPHAAPDPAFVSFTVSRVQNSLWDLEGIVSASDGSSTPMRNLDFNGARLVFSLDTQKRYRFTPDSNDEQRSGTLTPHDHPDARVLFNRLKY